MINIKIDNKEVNVFDEKLDSAKAFKIIRQAQDNPLYLIDFLDTFIDGGADKVFALLDPENEDPSLEKDVAPFIEKLFEEIGGQAKN